MKTGRLKKTLNGHSNSVNSVTYSPDGKTLASGSRDNTIKLWDVSEFTLTLTPTLIEKPIEKPKPSFFQKLLGR